MKTVFDIIKKPDIIKVTEKSNKALDGFNEVTLHVDIDATKPLIKRAVETLFGAQVVSVRTSPFGGVHGKRKRRGRVEFKNPNWKKAIVRLSSDH